MNVDTVAMFMVEGDPRYKMDFFCFFSKLKRSHHNVYAFFRRYVRAM